jgi:hypothetical protein
VRGAVALRRYLHWQDTIDIAIGLFEAMSSTTMVGGPCRYVIRIANVSDNTWHVTVTLQVSAMTLGPMPAPPSVRFSKHWSIPPRCTTAIECVYDWRTAAVFMVDESPSAPDEFWQLELKTPQRYVVSAILSDLTGKHLDQLDIYQELQG